jgi:hypothetical protein
MLLTTFLQIFHSKSNICLLQKNTQIKNYSYNYSLFCVLNFMLAACRPNVASLPRHIKGSTNNTCAKASVLKLYLQCHIITVHRHGPINDNVMRLVTACIRIQCILHQFGTDKIETSPDLL